MVINPFIIETTQYTCGFDFLLIVISVNCDLLYFLNILYTILSINKNKLEIEWYFKYSRIHRVVNIPCYVLNQRSY